MPNPIHSFKTELHNASAGYIKALKLLERHDLGSALRVAVKARRALPDARDARDARAYNISLFDLEGLSGQRMAISGDIFMLRREILSSRRDPF